MTTTLNVQLFEVDNQGLTVIVGNRFASHLGKDEALGVIAACLFGNVERIPYIQTYEQWLHYDQWLRKSGPQQPVALLTFKQSTINHQ